MKPRLLLSIIAVVALAIAGAAVIILTARQPQRTEPQPYDSFATRDPARPPNCQDSIEILFDTDAEMEQASNDLENDSRFHYASFMTKAQNYERFKRAFADQPELLARARPESMPAVATLMVSYAGQTADLVESLQQRYGSAKVTVPCDMPASSTRPVPATRTTR
ncbi:permease-like cell division protein FtsX [Kibdelosporangium persicum]|uniref:FtsX extracellular domain-containing protein n=1 Tax=Kibdelosporangium persicum TaxID=2698649 RepID=A0ABX2F619_9PSEU|nr:permease-like cell division protein FtsX [Kibdelosporangium persicum]NRN66790.1 hypothetical protein [Kibdelosporangium persicum]